MSSWTPSRSSSARWTTRSTRCAARGPAPTSLSYVPSPLHWRAGRIAHPTQVATRYAAFFSRVTALLDDEAVEHSLLRIRAHVERLAKTTPEATRALLKTLEVRNSLHRPVPPSFLTPALQTGPAATSHPRIQAELSHWTELERTM